MELNPWEILIGAVVGSLIFLFGFYSGRNSMK